MPRSAIRWPPQLPVRLAIGPLMPPRRLQHSKDIRAVFAAGQASHGPSVAVRGRERDDAAGVARVTVSASKRLGGAVHRNRAKRRIRAALGHIEVPAGWDLVVLAKAAASSTPFDALVLELQRNVSRLARRRKVPA